MLVPGQPFSEELVKIAELKGRIGHCAQGHDGDRDFAALLVASPDHRDFDDRRVAGEDVLDLGAVDVLAAGDDHVFLAVDNPDVSLVVLTHQVARMEPATGKRFGGGLRVVPIPVHQIWRAIDDPTDMTDRYVIHVVVDDSSADGRYHLPDGPEFAKGVVAQQHARHR